MNIAAPSGQNSICDVYVAAIPSDLTVEPVWPPEREDEIRHTSHEARKKQRYFVWKLLEYAVCRSFGPVWRDLTFCKEPSGKWSCDRVFFSLSHTDGVVAVAVSDGPVGIDIENISIFTEKFRGRVPALLKKITTESEQEVLDGEGSLAALDLWTKKESLFKCWGAGKFAPRKLDTTGQPVKSCSLTVPAPVYLSLCGEKVANAQYYRYEHQSAHRMEPNQIVRTEQYAKGNDPMKITTVLFDLDGTLLPMDQDQFVKAYFGLLAKKLAGHGYVPEELIQAIWAGTAAMVKNDGSRRNEDAFWESFAGRYGEDVRKDEPIFAEFYHNEFCGAKAVCGYTPKAAEVIALLKGKGMRVALATNPLFPAMATENRIRWAGLTPEDFEIYTTYENSSYCKPNPDYYREVVARLGVQPEECLMVGNDVTEDMVAETLGMKVFLLTDCIINKEEKDISIYPHGDFDALIKFLEALDN